MEKIRAAVIGCGHIFTMHVTPLKHSGQAELAAVCDVKADRAERAGAKHGVPWFTDYRRMIDEVRPDAVHVCTPHYLHPVITQYCLRRGVHVLCEKPMAIDYRDALACVELAERQNLRYGVIFQCRYNTASRMVKQTLEQGLLGRIISARTTLTWTRPDSYYLESDWKGTWDKEGGGVLIDQAIHSLDLANWFIGSRPESVSASIANRHHSAVQVEDSAEGLIVYENGVRLGFYAMNNYGCDEPIEIRLFCEKGTVRMSYDDATVTLHDGRVLTARQEESGIVYEDGKDYWGFQHIKQIEQFYRSVRGLEPLEISGREALKVQELVCRIYEDGRPRMAFAGTGERTAEKV